MFWYSRYVCFVKNVVVNFILNFFLFIYFCVIVCFWFVYLLVVVLCLGCWVFSFLFYLVFLGGWDWFFCYYLWMDSFYMVVLVMVFCFWWLDWLVRVCFWKWEFGRYWGLVGLWWLRSIVVGLWGRLVILFFVGL